jgi:4-hydroxy-3-methylbut-2-enyl diphosphate reductase
VKIELSQHLGYCFGVRRAMDLAFQNLAKRNGPVYSHGPLIHNKPARELLAGKGLKLWPGHDDSGRATVIIRAHGLPPVEEEDLRVQGVKVVDATCPKVAGVQRLVQKQAAEGRQVLIWGSAGHPEVEGLLGYAAGRGVVFGRPEDVCSLPDYGGVFLVAQTTQDHDEWPEVIKAVLARWPRAGYRDTICKATINRQREAIRLSEEADLLVVVGGRDSGNTKRLAALAGRGGKITVAVEGPEELEALDIREIKTLGLLSGASTPIWQIRAVLQRLEALGRHNEFNLSGFFRRLFRALALSNIYAGLGAGLLGWAISVWGGYPMPDIFFGLSFFYVQAMHLLNGFLDRESARYNDPDRAVFLRQYRLPLMAAGIWSLILSLSAAYLAGSLVLMQLIIQSFLGLFYAVRWPFSVAGIRRLKDLPLSKTLSISLGWAALLVLPPVLAQPPLIARTWAGAGLVALMGGAVFLNVLARTMLMDLQDAYGDRLFGDTTVVTILGQRGAARLLRGLLIIWSMYLLLAYIVCGRPPVIIWLWLAGPVYNLVIAHLFFRNPGLRGFQFDLMVDAQFIFSGAAAACLWFLS